MSSDVASYNGVKFFVETEERSGGRRGVVHEYPHRDVPSFDDLGRKARVFPVEGYVVGADYVAKRDALLTELEKPGPGELIHPTYGTRRVVVSGDFRARGSRDERRVARFSIEFTEVAAGPAQPIATPDIGAQALASALAARAAAVTEFLSKYASALDKTSIIGSIQAATGSINTALATVQLEGPVRAAIETKLDNLTSSAETLAGTPEDLAGDLTDLFTSIACDVGTLLAVYTFNPGVRPPATTAARAQEQANFDAVRRLIQRHIVTRAAEIALTTRFDSYEAAVASRESITELLDEQAELASDDAYPALQQLRADLVRAVPDPSADLAHVLPYTPPRTVNSLVLAYQLYGGVALEQDLVKRNRIRHPGFIPGGRKLEVLSDG
jgi:prophage DNA circulation protein